MATFYTYDKRTGYYTGTKTTDGTYRPANSTDIEPPNNGVEMKFNTREWKHVPRTPKGLGQLKTEATNKLHLEFQKEYDDYLAKYSVGEVSTFPIKQAEATAYTLDNTSPVPGINAMVGGDETLKVELITSIMNKIIYRAGKEGQMVAKRTAIKNALTLEALQVVIEN